jgi:hypothetical protein
MRTNYPTRTVSSFWDQLSFFGRQLCFCVICFSANEAYAQFTVERSPWLDSGAVTDEPIEQTWAVQDAANNRAMDVEVIVEGLNPRKAVSLTIPEEKILSLQPQRRYTRICVEPDYMMYSDRIYADPSVLRDTMKLLPLAVGMEVELEPIVFYPGTNDLYFSSIPTLEALLTFLKVNPTLTLSIQSNQGFSDAAKDLGMAKRERARAVTQYLLNSGIAAQRLAIESSSKRVTPNREPETIEEAEAAQRITVRVTNY